MFQGAKSKGLRSLLNDDLHDALQRRGMGFSVFEDYASSPESCENTLLFASVF
jgi:hypothetical protein